jgi:hypothetical protein
LTRCASSSVLTRASPSDVMHDQPSLSSAQAVFQLAA